MKSTKKFNFTTRGKDIIVIISGREYRFSRLCFLFISIIVGIVGIIPVGIIGFIINILGVILGFISTIFKGIGNVLSSIGNGLSSIGNVLSFPLRLLYSYLVSVYCDRDKKRA